MIRSPRHLRLWRRTGLLLSPERLSCAALRDFLCSLLAVSVRWRQGLPTSGRAVSIAPPLGRNAPAPTEKSPPLFAKSPQLLPKTPLVSAPPSRLFVPLGAHVFRAPRASRGWSATSGKSDRNIEPKTSPSLNEGRAMTEKVDFAPHFVGATRCDSQKRCNFAVDYVQQRRIHSTTSRS